MSNHIEVTKLDTVKVDECRVQVPAEHYRLAEDLLRSYGKTESLGEAVSVILELGDHSMDEDQIKMVVEQMAKKQQRRTSKKLDME